MLRDGFCKCPTTTHETGGGLPLREDGCVQEGHRLRMGHRLRGQRSAPLSLQGVPETRQIRRCVGELSHLPQSLRSEARSRAEGALLLLPRVPRVRDGSPESHRVLEPHRLRPRRSRQVEVRSMPRKVCHQVSSDLSK